MFFYSIFWRVFLPFDTIFSRHDRVILVKKAQGFLDGFGVFWKNKIFFVPVILLKSFILFFQM